MLKQNYKILFLLCLFIGGVILFTFFSIKGDRLALRADTIYYAPTQQGWVVDLADDDKERRRGLMFVKQMSDDRGMLFKFDELQIITMWMKNTFIPLDMIFLDSQGVIVHVHERAVPHSLETISSKYPSKFVLEINAGQAKQAGLEVGEKMLHVWFRH